MQRGNDIQRKREEGRAIKRIKYKGVQGVKPST